MLNISRSLTQIEGKLREASNHIGTVGYMTNEEDVQIVSELMDDTRDAIIDYQVSGALKPFP